MNWKNYFYFQRGEKTAILILLALITISGAVYIVTRPSPKINNIQSDSQLEQEFDEFQSQLISNEATKPDTIRHAKGTSARDYYHKKLIQGETIELNKADTSQLKRIPGIGSSFANRIVKYRNLLGGYVHIDQLKEVWGMDDHLFAQTSSFLTIEDTDVQRIRINTASFQELNKHPYISYKQVQVIVDIRERKGKIESMNRLALLDEFPNSATKRLTPYLDFD